MGREPDQSEGKPPFGHRPDERVYRAGPYAPSPEVRTRVGPIAMPEGLDFEPEVEGQAEALRTLLAPGPAPQSGLAFEAEEGGARERLSERPSSRAAVPGEEDIASLLDLAAGRPRGTAAHAPSPAPPVPPAPLDAAAGPAAFRGRRPATGDIEAELFGPASSRRAAVEPAAPVAPAGKPPIPDPAPGPLPGAAVGAAESQGTEEPPATQSVPSVFLSERVLGRRRRRRTTGFLRRSAHLRAVADRWLGRIYLRARRAFSVLDRFTGKARLPLVSIIWAAGIAGLALLFGVALPFAGGILAAGLILTVAGQPARNLLGIAGIMILSASLAEIVRQRERFLEILLYLFG